MLGKKVGKLPNVLARNPLPDERIEIVERRKMSPIKPLVAFEVAFLQKEKGGYEAVPRVSGEGEFEALSEKFRRQHRAKSFQRGVSAVSSEKALANGCSRAFRDVHKYAFFRGDLLLKQAKTIRTTNLEPDAR